MIKLLNKLPDYDQPLGVAVSGGVDSMVALDFILKGNRNPVVFHFNHGTEHSKHAQSFVEQYCDDNGLPLKIGAISGEKPAGASSEEFWRDERYAFFDQFTDHKIVMAHHLDDCLETWLFSSFHGCPKVIPYSRGNIIRPFLLTKKEKLVEWAIRYGVRYVQDDSNYSMDHMRNRIRHKIVPQVLKVNPGVHKHVERLVKEKHDVK